LTSAADATQVGPASFASGEPIEIDGNVVKTFRVRTMTKRGNGEGSIYQRSDGRWVASLWVGGSRKYLYGRTRQDVARRLNEVLHSAQEGIYVDPGRMTVGQLVDEWLVTAETSVGRSTWIRYEQYVRVHIKPAIGSVPLRTLSPRHVQALYTRSLEGGSSATTVNHVHTVLHTALQYGLRMDYIRRNVAALCTPPRKIEQVVRTLTVEEAKRLLTSASGDRLEALFYLALFTGMRQGELLALRWDDIDLELSTAGVRGSVRRINGELCIGQPKTKRSRRQVALAEPAVEALRRHKATQAAERLAAGSTWQDLGLVFSDASGGPLDAQQVVRRHFRPLLRHAGLPRIKFHALRHSAATLLLGLGVHPVVVQEMLGHSAVSVTMDIYSHATPTLQRDAATALGQRLFATL
jgi:integrase